MPRDIRSEIRDHLAASANAFMALSTDTALLNSIVQAAELINKVFAQGNKICIAGNGGSATDADHFAAELVGRYKKGDKALPAISLTNPATITAVGNDYSVEEIFARQLNAYGRHGDVFFAISTSGNSPNIMRGLEVAREIGMFRIGLLGTSGAASFPGVCDIPLRVPATYTPRVQELHIAVIHALCECIDR